MSFKNLDYIKIFFVALIAILTVSNIYTYIDLQNHITFLQTKMETLDAYYQNLNDAYQSLNVSYQNLNDAYQSLNVSYQNYVSNHSYTDSEYDSQSTSLQNLNLTFQEYVATHNYTNSEYEELRNERDMLMIPKLSIISLHLDDVRPLLESPRLHIYGEVWNVGSDTAYNCELHIVAYQGSVKAIDAEIFLGTIEGENRVSLEQNVYYTGEALTGAFPTLVWTVSP
jgi:hypothetical protein